MCSFGYVLTDENFNIRKIVLIIVAFVLLIIGNYLPKKVQENRRPLNRKLAYLFVGIGFLFLSELIRVLLKKSDWKHFGISSGVLALAFLLGIGMNSQRLLANREYAEETVRGKQILEDEKQNHASKDGMNRDAMLMWSYGKLETLNLFIPRIYGGSSQEKGSDRIMQNIQELVQ